MSVLGGCVLAGIVVLLWLTTQFVIVPYIRMEILRRKSRAHTPQPEELWVQLRPEGGEDLLYIDSVGPTGVEIMIYDPHSKQFARWKDTWNEWVERLRVRTIWFTGQKRPLGPE